MESVLYKEGIFPFRSAAASMGGRGDRGKEMTERGREYVIKALKRNDVPMLPVPSIKADIDERMAIYFRGPPPKAYINVGGGVVSAGIRPSKLSLESGLLKESSIAPTNVDSVIRRFLQADIPVIHLENVRQLAEQHGLPIAPATTPKIGTGTLYFQREYNLWLAGAALAAIIAGLYLFSRSDWGFRILQTTSHREDSGPPEPMV
jgi:poly-gamma-glutamate system protein